MTSPASCPSPAGRGTRRAGQLLRTCARAVLHVLYTATVLLGLLVTPLYATLVFAPVLGMAAAAVHAELARSLTGARPAGARLALTALTTAGFVPFTQGLRLLQSAGVVVGLLVVGLFTVLVATGITHLAPAAPARRTGPAAEQPLRELLRVLPLDMLVSEWADLHRGPDHGSSHAEHYRRLLLDELSRRDPTADRWWRSGAAEPPYRGLRDDRGSPA